MIQNDSRSILFFGIYFIKSIHISFQKLKEAVPQIVELLNHIQRLREGSKVNLKWMLHLQVQ